MCLQINLAGDIHKNYIYDNVCDCRYKLDMPGPELWEAATGNDVAGVRRCLARGDEVDGRGGSNNSTPLMEATRRTDPTVLLMLLCDGANLEARDADSETALFLAAINDNVNCARVLTSLGADVNSMNRLW